MRVVLLFVTFADWIDNLLPLNIMIARMHPTVGHKYSMTIVDALDMVVGGGCHPVLLFEERVPQLHLWTDSQQYNSWHGLVSTKYSHHSMGSTTICKVATVSSR